MKKYHKRKKHRRSSFSKKDETVAESSIIQCMLSSPEALLRYSLWNGNLKQALQVIEVCVQVINITSFCIIFIYYLTFTFHFI